MTHRTRAFTLLELMLAIAITAILAATVYASLMVATRTRDRAAEAVGKGRAITLALDLVRRDLQSIPPPTGTMAGAFLGADDHELDEVTFTTANAYLPPDDRLADLINVRIALAEDPDDDRSLMLVREITTNLLAPSATEPQVQVLVRGVTGLDLQYSDGADWIDDWDSTQYDNTLPLAVKVTLYHPPQDTEQYTTGDEQASLIVMLPAGQRGDSVLSGVGGLGR